MHHIISTCRVNQRDWDQTSCRGIAPSPVRLSSELHHLTACNVFEQERRKIQWFLRIKRVQTIKIIHIYMHAHVYCIFVGYDDDGRLGTAHPKTCLSKKTLNWSQSCRNDVHLPQSIFLSAKSESKLTNRGVSVFILFLTKFLFLCFCSQRWYKVMLFSCSSLSNPFCSHQRTFRLLCFQTRRRCRTSACGLFYLRPSPSSPPAGFGPCESTRALQKNK